MTIDIGVAAAPAHVSKDRIVDFDFCNDERFLNGDMHDAMQWLACNTPGVFWTPRNGGHWVISQYEHLFAASRDSVLFSNRLATLPPMENEPTLIPFSLDPPEHGAYRLPLMKAFSPSAMRGLENKICRLATELIDAIVTKDRCDFVADMGELLPVMVFMELMGMPLDRLHEFRSWASVTFAGGAQRDEAFVKIRDMMSELIVARQAKREEDLISSLLDSQIHGRPVTFDEMLGYCTLLFIAGLDTVANSMALGIRHLAREPELQQQLRDNPALIPEATEELLRRFSTSLTGRVVTRDAVFAGVEMKEGERVLLALPAGNLDPQTFPDARRVDMGRDNKNHLAFNTGAHRCVGSHLARIELTVAYREWLRRIPYFRMDPDRPAIFRQGFALAVNSLPLVLRDASKSLQAA